jgi:7-carboxy-7-deazaguanine synthase
MQISEVYTSTQGEGPKVGLPTIFLRFAGCNLKCPGWPCDTQHAIDPRLYRDQWQVRGSQQVAEMVLEESRKTGATNVCFTGGEPFLQNHAHLKELVTDLVTMNPQFEFEVFTNGTLLWPTWAPYRFSFIMDWKLTGSGDASAPDVMMRNASRLTSKDVIKFTVVDKSDFAEAVAVWNMYSVRDLREPQVFCGPVFGKCEPSDVASWILESRLPWRLNIQAHKYIFDPDARRV